MARLRASLSADGLTCPSLWVKRDDCTGLAGGGNKARKLEFLVGEALAAGCDVLVTTGALQSNHARQTAAAAAAAGLGAALVLHDMVSYPEPAYGASGNRLMDDILGAEVHVVPGPADPQARVERVLQDLRRTGRRPYLIPTGGSNPCGAFGYVAGGLELIEQLRPEGDPARTLIVHATSSGGTQAGLLVAAANVAPGPTILGVNVYRRDTAAMAADILALAMQTADALGARGPDAVDVRLDNDWLGHGYGAPTMAMREAVERVARTEGVILDPVYSGKAMAGLLGLIASGRATGFDRIVFLHTGGLPSLFAYAAALTAPRPGSPA